MTEDLVWSFRQMRRRPRLTTAIVAPLALGFGALLAAYAVVSRLLFAPLDFPASHELVAIDQQSATLGGVLPFSTGNYLDVQQRQRSFAALTAYEAADMTLTEGEEPLRLKTAHVTPSFFDVLGVRPAVGRAFTAEEARLANAQTAILRATPYLLLSDRLWAERFGRRADLVGKSVSLDGQPYQVVGVMPPGFDFPHGVQAWTPLGFGDIAPQDRGGFYIQVLGRLRAGVSPEQARQDLDRIARELRPVSPQINGDMAFPLTPLQEKLVGDRRTALWLLLALAGVILLGMAANVAQLLLARAAERQRDVAVRMALGAERAVLARQQLAETVLLTGLGCILGGLLAAWGLKLFLALAAFDLTGFGAVRLDARVLAGAVAFTLATAAVCGLAPALAVSRPGLALRLAEGSRHASLSRSHRRFHRLLSIAQMAVAVVLICAALLVAKSYARVLAVEPGFEPRGLLTLDLTLPENRYQGPDAVRAFVERACTGLAGLPGVTGVAAALRLPVLDEPGGIWFRLPGAPAGEAGSEPAATFNPVTAGYFEVMKIPLRRGRGIAAEDGAGGTPVVVIDEELARQFFSGQDPVGKSLELTPFPGMPWQIVGVAQNVKQAGLRTPAFPTVYVPLAQLPLPRLRFAVRTASAPASLAQAARERIWEIDRQLAFEEVGSFEERLGEILRPERLTLGLVGAFGLLGLVLVALGIYSSTAYLMSQRVPDLLVRMAFGAQRGDVLRHVLASGAVEIVLGLVLGGAVTLALARFGRTLLFEVSPMDPWMLAAGLGLPALAALAAMFLPARRVARIDPARVLR